MFSGSPFGRIGIEPTGGCEYNFRLSRDEVSNLKTLLDNIEVCEVQNDLNQGICQGNMYNYKLSYTIDSESSEVNIAPICSTHRYTVLCQESQRNLDFYLYVRGLVESKVEDENCRNAFLNLIPDY